MIQYECEADFQAHMNANEEALRAEHEEKIYSEIDECKKQIEYIQMKIDDLRSVLP